VPESLTAANCGDQLAFLAGLLELLEDLRAVEVGGDLDALRLQRDVHCLHVLCNNSPLLHFCDRYGVIFYVRAFIIDQHRVFLYYLYIVCLLYGAFLKKSNAPTKCQVLIAGSTVSLSHIPDLRTEKLIGFRWIYEIVIATKMSKLVGVKRLPLTEKQHENCIAFMKHQTAIYAKGYDCHLATPDEFESKRVLFRPEAGDLTLAVIVLRELCEENSKKPYLPK